MSHYVIADVLAAAALALGGDFIEELDI